MKYTKCLGPMVRKVNSAIHRIVIFSTIVKMLESYETTDTYSYFIKRSFNFKILNINQAYTSK